MTDGSLRIRLLLVDDDIDVATMYEMQLAAHGFQVITAHSGTEAIDRAGAEHPDLIYLDLGLPEMHGFDVLEQLRAAPRTAGIPVVILTNYSEPELVERGRELGVHDYLIKAHTPPAALAEATRKWVW
jgi:two-component system, OmpR family, alkaline phosphatase synthesis response regulator PhoP